jgi:hypothetical protein
MKSERLSVRSDLDPRSWTARELCDTWVRLGGSVQSVMGAVAGKTNNPRLYSGILQVAVVLARQNSILSDKIYDPLVSPEPLPEFVDILIPQAIADEVYQSIQVE